MSNDKSHLLEGHWPKTWDEYVGQDAAKDALQTMAVASRMRNEPLPHTMIECSTPGNGKTALAILTARAAGRKVYPVSGQMDVNAALDMFECVSDGDIIFYDEFHQIAEGGKTRQGWLLNYLENGVLMTKYGVEQVPKVTFLTATTDKAMLLPAILDRFEIVTLDPYTDEQAADIAVQLSTHLMPAAGLPLPDKSTAAAVARAGNNAPRQMRRLLSKLRDLATIGKIAPDHMGRYPLEQALVLSGLTEDGLTKDAVQYMQILKEAGRKPVGEGVLKARMGMGRGDGLKHIELLLNAKGYMALTSSGRTLTQAGRLRTRQVLGEAA